MVHDMKQNREMLREVERVWSGHLTTNQRKQLHDYVQNSPANRKARMWKRRRRNVIIGVLVVLLAVVCASWFTK